MKKLTDLEIEKKIISGKDIIGREEVYKFKKVDSSFPDYVLKNHQKYKEWIVN